MVMMRVMVSDLTTLSGVRNGERSNRVNEERDTGLNSREPTIWREGIKI
jgi:hypothetical protein